jgi:hypothetical protein
MAEHPYTSYLEATGMFDSVRELAESHATTQTTLQFRVQLESVLDLTIVANLQALGTTTDEINASWEWQMVSGQRVPTQELGAAAFDCARQVLRLPSIVRR